MTARSATFALLLLVLAAKPVEAELVGPEGAVMPRGAPRSEASNAAEDGWRAELARLFSGTSPDSGELMAVVLPPGPGPVTPPPVVPPPVVPPPFGGGVGREDQDQGGIAQPPVTPIPEPGSMALLALGASGLLGYRCLQRRRGSLARVQRR